MDSDSGTHAVRRPRAARGGPHRVVMWRYRIPPRGLPAMIGALVYLASPIDVLPEVMLGPLGLLDDAGAVTAAAIFVYKLATAKRRLQDAGVKGRRRPDLLE